MASVVSPRSFVDVDPERNFPKSHRDHQRALQAGACAHPDADPRHRPAEDMPSLPPRFSAEALHG